MKQSRPRWSGSLDCPPEQGFFGLLRLEAPTREDHLEGAARWAPFHRRAHRCALAGAGGDPPAALYARSGRVVRDLAVMLADGGDCLADLRAVRDQRPLFG